jgi:hypothetical protein
MANKTSSQKSADQTKIELVYYIRVSRLAGPGEVERHPVDIDPVIERPGDKLRPVVDPDLGWRSAALEHTTRSMTSTTVKARNRLPLNRASETKSIVQISFGCAASGRSTRTEPP